LEQWYVFFGASEKQKHEYELMQAGSIQGAAAARG
jgi:hypothetical protein